LSVLVLTSQATCHSIEFQIRKRRLCTFIRNLGKNGQVDLTIKGGKISGRAEYWGSLQSFSVIFNPDGKWNGKIIKQLRKQKIAIVLRRGKISRQGMRQVSKLLHGNSEILLEVGKGRKSKKGDSELGIRLMLSLKHEVCGFIKHKSGRHYTKIELSPGGRWNAQGWVRLPGARFLFSAKTGKCETRFEGAPRFATKRSGFRKG